MSACSTGRLAGCPAYAQQVRYDRVGRISGITRRATGAPVSNDEHYGYDAYDRLERVETATEKASWTYDTVGNRLTGAQGQTLIYQPASNRLAAIGDGDRKTAYNYDPAGNLLSIGMQRLHYDENGRLADVSTAAGPVARYAYNASGERVAKTTFDAHGTPRATYFLYQGQQFASEIDDSGRVTTQTVYLNQMPVVQLVYPSEKTGALATLRRGMGWIGWHDDATDSRLHALHTDHLGTPQLATDERQQVVWQARYSAFGLATIATQKITLNLRLPGQYFDAETGCHYNLFRDYDPTTGRYLQSDPIGLDGGFNTYGYVNGNPLGAIDVLGLAAQCPASCTPAQSSAMLRELSMQARLDGDVDAAYAYLRRALDVQNAVAACTLQGTTAGMSDEDAAILGGMVMNPSGTTPGGMPGSAGGGGRQNGGITNGVGGGFNSVAPAGFASAGEFAQFGNSLRTRLVRAGYSDAVPILQGSAVTGKSFKTGQPFDAGRVSDFDVALASPLLLSRAAELGIGLRSGGTRTGPLTARDLKLLGLSDLSNSLSQKSGREVNFMICNTPTTAVDRAPSITLPNLGK